MRHYSLAQLRGYIKAIERHEQERLDQQTALAGISATARLGL